jgi:SAM-dependent methyltransferase
MSFEAITTTAQRLGSAMEALATLGAELRLRRDGRSADPRVRPVMDEVIRQVDPQVLEGLTAEQETAALATIQSMFRQALDLLEDPARPPGWIYDDPSILVGQGQASRRIVHLINLLADRASPLKALLQEGGTFLDVGTGTGWLAIEAARAWSAMRVIGLDPWDRVLRIARENVAAAGVQDRVDLRLQGVQDLDEKETLSLVWLPGPFLPPEVAVEAAARAHAALKIGGWVVFGIFTPPEGGLGAALTALRMVRCGGHPWTTAEVERRLRTVGFDAVETFTAGPPAVLIAGQKVRS